MSKMNSVVHFEMPISNKDRVTDFYSKAFGWKMQPLGPDMGNYILISTTETGEDGRPKSPGAINGGFFEKSADNQHPSVVIAVDNIRDSIKKVKDAGGKVLGGYKGDGEPDEIPGVGLYAAFIDSEGNRVSMLQPKGM